MKMDFYKFFGYLSWLNYIWWLFELNVMILVVNFPLVLFLFAAEAGIWALPGLFVTGVTIGPSVLAAFKAMPYIEDGILKHYFRILKKDWIKCLKIWIPMWFLAMVVTADIIILERFRAMAALKWFLVLFLLLFASFATGFFLVWAQWGQRWRDAAVLACKLSFVKPFRFHLNVFILLGTAVLLGQKPVYLLLYGVGVGIFLVYKNFVPVFQFVNERPENRNVNTAMEEAQREEHA